MAIRICCLCSIFASIQQLRFGAAEQPASPSQAQQEGDAVAAADGGAGAQAAAVPQPLSPAEPVEAEVVAEEAELPDAPAAATPAYSSDDDGGGYDGGHWGGDSDAEALPAEFSAASPSQGPTAGFGSPAGNDGADIEVSAALQQDLPLVTPAPRPRAGRRTSGFKHKNERRKNARKSLAGTAVVPSVRGRAGHCNTHCVDTACACHYAL